MTHRRTSGVLVLALSLGFTIFGITAVVGAQGSTNTTVTTFHGIGTSTPTSIPPSDLNPIPVGSTGGGSNMPSINNDPVSPPTVSLEGSECTNADLRAQLEISGPSFGNGMQDVLISLTSSIPCVIEGYPELTFSGDSSTSLVDGIPFIDAPTMAQVELSTQDSGSFMIAFSDEGCPVSSTLNLSTPNDDQSPIVVEANTAADLISEMGNFEPTV
jgi:hypothetical protein